jgi:hypothetical protein
MGSGAIDLGGIGLNARHAAGSARGGAKQPARLSCPYGGPKETLAMAQRVYDEKIISQFLAVSTPNVSFVELTSCISSICKCDGGDGGHVEVLK